MKIKKLLSLILSITMLLTVLPLAVFAEGTTTAEDAVSHFPSMSEPYVELYDEYTDGASYDWLKDGESIGVTDRSLEYYDVDLFSAYTCNITLSDGSQFGVQFMSTPLIEYQPTNSDAYMEVTGYDDPNVKIEYQWYARALHHTEITDKNASNECSTCENTTFSTYDAESNTWTGKRIGIDVNGDKEYFVFEVELKEGEQLLIDAEPDVNNVQISDKDFDIITTAGYTLVGNIFVYTVEQTDTYKISVCTPNDEPVISAYIRTFDEEPYAVENETAHKLAYFEYGVYYYCVAKYENGFELKSNTIINVPEVYSHPSALYPTFEVAYDPDTEFQWYEITYDANDSEKPLITKLDGENTDTLKNLEPFHTYYCEARFPALSNIVSDEFVAIPEIIEQPTFDNPTFAVTFSEFAEFRWYTVTETSSIVTDKDVDTSYGSFDSESGLWTPYYSDPYDYYDYEERLMELFDIHLYEGEQLTITITNPDAISPKDPEFRFYCNGDNSEHIKFDEDNVITFTAHSDNVYQLYQYGINPEETQYKVEKITFEPNVELENETEDTLLNAQRNERYIAKAIFDNGFELTSAAVKMIPAIIKQPTADDVSVKMNIIEDEMTYQWYGSYEQTTVPVTSDMIEYTDSSNISGYNDETNEWDPCVYRADEEDGPEKYELDLFILPMEAGDTIVFEASETITGRYIRVFDNHGDFGQSIYPDEDGLYKFTAGDDYDCYFYFRHYTDDITIKANLTSYNDYEKLDGENKPALQNIDIAAYKCVITYDEDDVVVSDKVYVYPIITKQPTSDDPSIDVNVDDKNAKYQWYRVEETTAPVTDKDVIELIPVSEEETDSRYDAEKDEWTAEIVSEISAEDQTAYIQLLFTINLLPNEIITIYPNSEIPNAILFVADDQDNSFLTADDDGNYAFTASEETTYRFYIIRFESDPFKFKATKSIYALSDKLDSETESVLKTNEAGIYTCEITFSDGTKLTTDIVKLETQGDVNGDGITNSNDYILVKRACFKTYELNDEEFSRADINGSNTIDSSDYTIVKRIAFGTYK